QRDDHVILMPELFGIAGRSHLGGFFLSADVQLEAVLPDRLEMRAARDQGHVSPGELHQNADIAADRARAVDTDFHFPSPKAASGGLAISIYNDLESRHTDEIPVRGTGQG